MTTANLYLVTNTLKRLLLLNVSSLLFRQGIPGVPEVTTMPPERVGAAQNTLNLHLYHVMEDAHYKNMTPAGRGGPPISRQPMTLLLYYILTSHHEINDVFDAEVQQRNFGLAMKSFHDYSEINDGVEISPDGGPRQQVMVPELMGGGNRLEISYRPLTPEESITFWSAEQSSTTRLSAYYEVRTVFLEPERPTGAVGTVFDLGLFVSAGSAPVLERVSAFSRFTPPARTGLGAQTFDMAPARVTLAPGMIPEVNRVRVSGSALSGGNQPSMARFVLRTAAWRELAPAVRFAFIDPALNPAWSVELSERSGKFDMQGVLVVDNGAGPVPLEVTPGIYALSVEVTRRTETRNGAIRETRSESNQVAFSVGARIDTIDPPNAFGRMVIRVLNLFDMTAPGLEVQLAIGGEIYNETGVFADDPAQDRGEFQRLAGRIEFHPLFDPLIAGEHPVRLAINGAESQPFWIVLP